MYNALCNTAHTDVNEIKLYTIDNVIYIEMKNDVSILLDSYLHLWEQQSSYNPNMPLRGLMYFSKMYDRYIVEHSYNIYGSTSESFQHRDIRCCTMVHRSSRHL